MTDESRSKSHREGTGVCPEGHTWECTWYVTRTTVQEIARGPVIDPSQCSLCGQRGVLMQPEVHA